MQGGSTQGFGGWRRALALGLVIALGAGCGGAGGTGPGPDGQDLTGTSGQRLYVATGTTLSAFDVASGQKLPGEVTDVTGPVNMQALEDGTLLVSLSGANRVLVVDGKTMLERARIVSGLGATRPVHTFVTPEHAGRRYFVSMHDGAGTPETNSAMFIDLNRTSPTYLQRVGEVGLGVGHHKAAFSANRERVVISNISDCDNVLSVYDYSDVANIRLVETYTAAEAGITTCKSTDTATRVRPSPHGCATAAGTGLAYCNLTGTGQLVEVDLDSEAPTFRLLAAAGRGGGYTKAGHDGRYVYSLQARPREGAGGANCQVGQLVVVDSEAGEIASQVPLFYRGCDSAAGLGDLQKDAAADHLVVSKDGATLFVHVGGEVPAGSGRTLQAQEELVLDLADPARPVQLASIAIGAHSGHRDGALTGDGKFLYVMNNVDRTVSQIDVATRAVVGTLETGAAPATLATWGSTVGPSAQTGPVH